LKSEAAIVIARLARAEEAEIDRAKEAPQIAREAESAEISRAAKAVKIARADRDAEITR